MLKKVIGIVIISTLCISCLCGCKKKPEETSPSVATQEPVKYDVAEKGEEPVTGEPEIIEVPAEVDVKAFYGECHVTLEEVKIIETDYGNLACVTMNVLNTGKVNITAQHVIECHAIQSDAPLMQPRNDYNLMKEHNQYVSLGKGQDTMVDYLFYIYSTSPLKVQITKRGSDTVLLEKEFSLE